MQKKLVMLKVLLEYERKRREMIQPLRLKKMLHLQNKMFRCSMQNIESQYNHHLQMQHGFESFEVKTKSIGCVRQIWHRLNNL